MNEKKPTDKEVVKALEHKLSKVHTQLITDCCGVFISEQDILDLIHRLQAEVEELRKAKVIHETVDYCYEDLKEAQAEIERLSKKAVALEVETNNQKAEIELLTEEKWKVQDDLDNYHAMLQESEKKNAELEKEVDELKIAYKDLIETYRNCDTTQVVKDTAIEVYSQVLEWIPICEGYGKFIGNLESWLKERYGVEVE